MDKELNKIIKISIRELISLNANINENFFNNNFIPNRELLGTKVHKLYQNSQKEKFLDRYISEYFIQEKYLVDNYTFIISGRIDGLYFVDNNTIILEEIKSVILSDDSFELIDVNNFESYLWQLNIYSFFLQKRFPNYNIISQLVFINVSNNKIKKIDIERNSDTIIEEYIKNCLYQYLRKIIEKDLKNEKKKEFEIIFPFKKFRKFQDEIIKIIEDEIKYNKYFIISAATGIGKTISSLYPTVKYIFKNEKKLVYLIAKTTQRYIVLETLKDLLKDFKYYNVINLQAKEKICKTEEKECTPEICPYLSNMYNLTLYNEILSDILDNQTIIESEFLIKKSEKFDICPFILSLDLIRYVDIIICDYNYVYSPEIALFSILENAKDTILIVDEAHNLVARAKDYYSPIIDINQLIQLDEVLTIFLPDIYKKIKKVISDLILFYQYKKNIFKSKQIIFNINEIKEILDNFEIIFQNFFISKKINNSKTQYDKEIINLYFQLKYFIMIMQKEEDNIENFVNIIDFENKYIKILCLDSSIFLKEINKLFNKIIFQSASLVPIEFYKNMLGIPEEKSIIIEKPSPFPKENILVLVDSTVSTAYRDRALSYETITEKIIEIIKLKMGNYLVFFPSYDYLNKIYDLLKNKISDMNILIQKSLMNEDERNDTINLLRNTNNNILLAIMGGIFGEGIDYLGDMCIGIIIIGPGLPKYTFEQELIKKYFDKYNKKGFDYAYTYPGINRVIQSTGRLIRSEKDKGIIVLFDKRFSEKKYLELFPSNWYSNNYYELIANQNIIDKIKLFWEEKDTSNL